MGNSFGRLSPSSLLRYALAVAAVLIAFLLSGIVTHFVGVEVAYILLLTAVAFSAWYGGIGPSVVAIGSGLIGAAFVFTLPLHSFRILTVAELVPAVAFVFSSIAIVTMGESRRRHNEKLRTQQYELEECVQERTADLDVANQNLRELSARLLQLQDDERRRIARELHDSVGQMLAALTMNLSAVRGEVERMAKTALAIVDSENLVQQMSSEVRTISHLLHPPLLDEAGLLSALRWYVEGFADRSKISVDLDLPERFGRLPRESETAIFRVVQECLTNIHRHSESPVAKVRLRQHDHQILVEVADKGKGIPPEKRHQMDSAGTPGVGLRGMRERLRQLGGTLELNSGGSGTVVVVRLPVPDNVPSQEALATPSAAAA